MEEIYVQLVFLACVLLGLCLRAWLGYATNSTKAWDWKLFSVSIIPSFFVVGGTVFTLEPILTFQAAFLLVLSSAGLSEMQSAGLKYVGSSNASLSK